MVCMFCNGFYGASHNQPVCATCHSFLYESSNEEDELLINAANFEHGSSTGSAVKKYNGDASDDSGTEDPYEERPLHNLVDITGSCQLNNNNNNSNNASFDNEQAADFEQEDFPPRSALVSKSSVTNGSQSHLKHSRNCLNGICSCAAAAAATASVSSASLSARSSSTGAAGAVGIPYSSRILGPRLTALTVASAYDKGSAFVGQVNNLSSQLPVVDMLATEILLAIFRHCDDMSLWTLRLVCARFQDIIDREVSEVEWRRFVELRWPLFRARCRIGSWCRLYSNLAFSAACRYCLENLYNYDLLFCAEATSWRLHRLRTEHRSLIADPPYGILTQPLDHSNYSKWMAAVAGPSGSPYEGGLFFLAITVPMSYPLRPPLVRFITKLFHPNVSRHGDIGLDCITSNWSLALTLAKVLVCVQSLLTDPYTRVCMEPEVGRLYREHRALFDRTAQEWTWRYAMHDYLPAASSSSPLFLSSRGSVTPFYRVISPSAPQSLQHPQRSIDEDDDSTVLKASL